MATALTPLQAEQRANMDVLFESGNPTSRKGKTQAQRHTDALRNTLEKQIRATGSDRPVTLLNLNPTLLKINGGMLFPEEIPACPIDQPYVVYVFRETRWGSRDTGVGFDNVHRVDPVPYVPKTLAAEYMRQYQQETDGFGGVICYMGDRDPATIKKGEMVTVPVVNMVDGELVIEEEERDFHGLMGVVRAKRNRTILGRIQEANAWYENDEQRKNVNDSHRDMARLAFKEELIPELPRWVLQENLETKKRPDACPLCQTTPKHGAIICTNCNHVFDVIGAYKNTRIAYGDVAMDRLDAKGWAEVEAIREQREKARPKKVAS